MLDWEPPNRREEEEGKSREIILAKILFYLKYFELNFLAGSSSSRGLLSPRGAPVAKGPLHGSGKKTEAVLLVGDRSEYVLASPGAPRASALGGTGVHTAAG